MKKLSNSRTTGRMVEANAVTAAVGVVLLFIVEGLLKIEVGENVKASLMTLLLCFLSPTLSRYIAWRDENDN